VTDQPETQPCGGEKPHPAHRFMIGRQVRQCPGRALTETCCVCGGLSIAYRNYREQPFCQPCADPAAKAESELDTARRNAITFQTRLDAARAWARRNLTAEQQTGLLGVLRGDQPKETPDA
jgi:hypothetical protein